MRLKKGTKVEVMNKEEGLIGSWCPATIVSGNGRSYYVIYNPNSACSDVQAETVTKKAIRPCPPPVRGIKDLASGDIVEVNHNQLWKAAIILNANSRNNYTVSLLGYMGVFNCHRHQLRIRQVWKDDKWFVIGKVTFFCLYARMVR